MARRSKRASAWASIVHQCSRYTRTQGGLRNLRIAGETIGLSIEDMEDIEAAIGYRSKDMAVLFDLWKTVRQFRPHKEASKPGKEKP